MNIYFQKLRWVTKRDTAHHTSIQDGCYTDETQDSGGNQRWYLKMALASCWEQELATLVLLYLIHTPFPKPWLFHYRQVTPLSSALRFEMMEKHSLDSIPVPKCPTGHRGATKPVEKKKSEFPQRNNRITYVNLEVKPSASTRHLIRFPCWWISAPPPQVWKEGVSWSTLSLHGGFYSSTGNAKQRALFHTFAFIIFHLQLKILHFGWYSTKASSPETKGTVAEWGLMARGLGREGSSVFISSLVGRQPWALSGGSEGLFPMPPPPPKKYSYVEGPNGSAHLERAERTGTSFHHLLLPTLVVLSPFVHQIKRW